MKKTIPTIATAAVLAVSLSGAPPVEAGDASEVTRGRFESTALGAERGYDIRGGAVMIRTDLHRGHTVVISHAGGLDPGTTYPSHVHDAPCSTGGGGHYQHDVGGAVDAENEIWPTLHTRRSGHATALATHDHRARPEAQSIVIHDPADGGRLACLDLG